MEQSANARRFLDEAPFGSRVPVTLLRRKRVFCTSAFLAEVARRGLEPAALRVLLDTGQASEVKSAEDADLVFIGNDEAPPTQPHLTWRALLDALQPSVDS